MPESTLVAQLFSRWRRHDGPLADPGQPLVARAWEGLPSQERPPQAGAELQPLASWGITLAPRLESVPVAAADRSSPATVVRTPSAGRPSTDLLLRPLPPLPSPSVEPLSASEAEHWAEPAFSPAEAGSDGRLALSRPPGARALLCGCALCLGLASSRRLEPQDDADGPRVGTPASTMPGTPVLRVAGQALGAEAELSRGPAAALAATVADALVIADADVLNLETNPGASKTIYLNFLGANLSGTAWIPSGTSWSGIAPAFSLDSDTSTNFSTAELAAIKQIFARVACDYAPFNVNVTTKAPSNDRINRSSSSDNVYGTVCLFSNISSQTGNSGSGGVAFIGVFDGVNVDAYKPALVFPDMLSYSAKNIAEAASHEVGHNLNLRHDGTSATPYYEGQGSSPGWAPIMGVGYYRALTQFNAGTYPGANNQENDFQNIVNEGVGYWADAVGNDIASAASLTLTDANGDGLSDKLQVGGTIELTAANGLGMPDQDFYGFLAPSVGNVTINVRNALSYFDPAAARFTFAPVPTGYGNLRLDARLHDAAGVVLADWSNNGSLDVTNFTMSGLIGGRQYYLSVLANASSPDGEGTYGSLGDYVIDMVYQGQPGPASPTYALSAPVSVQEGQVLPISLDTTNVADGSVLNWRLSGNGISSDDFAPAALTGSVTVLGGAALVSGLSVAADNLIEPTETALLELLDGGSVVASRSISLLDTNVRWGTANNDTIAGMDNRFERITGVLAGGIGVTDLGSNQVDVVTGGVGPDEFLLSENRSGKLRVFYDDGTMKNTGLQNYLRIDDFSRSFDKLRFAGGRYFSVNSGADTQIWWDRNNNGSLSTLSNSSLSDELIGVLKGVSLGGAVLTSASALPWVVFG